MKQYIESFHIFKEANRGCEHPLSAEMVEKELINMLKNLHYVYLNDKVKNGISYTLSAKISMIAFSGASTTMQENGQMHYDIAHVITNHLIDRHRDEVESHFQNSHPEDCDYCNLLKGTIFKEMVDDKKCKEEIEYKKPPEYMHVQVYEEKKHSSFGCTLTDTQKEALVNFLNTANINHDRTSLQNIEDFLDCKDGFYLWPRVNTHASFILGLLHEDGFINNNWAHLTGSRNLLRSSSGKKFLSSHDITQSYHSIIKKGIQNLSPSERRIYDFISQLKLISEQ